MTEGTQPNKTQARGGLGLVTKGANKKKLSEDSLQVICM